MQLRPLLTAALLLAVFAAPTRARATCDAEPLPGACVSFRLEADVSEPGDVDDPDGILGSVADTLVLTVTVDTSIPDVAPGAIEGAYPAAVACSTFDFGERTLTMIGTSLDLEPPNGIFVRNDDPLGKLLLDEFQMGMDETPIASIGGQVAVAAFDVIFGTACFDPVFPCPPTMLTSDALPVPPPAPGASQVTPGEDGMRLIVAVAGLENADVNGDPLTMTQVPAVACPEPSPALASAGSVIALAAVARLRPGARRASSEGRSARTSLR